MRRSHHSASALLLVLVLLFLPLSAIAQERSEPPSENSSEQTTEQSEKKVASESKEASGKEAAENQTEHFKHSSSVKLVSKLTGLSLEGAYWFCVVLNFAIVAAFIGWALKKNLPGVFRNRTQSIQQAMQEARKASEQANNRLAEIEKRLSRLDVEIGEMHTAAEKEAVAEESKIKAAAEEDARKIVESAEQEIAAAAKTARRELTVYAADLAVSLAQKGIKVDPATDQALVKGFAEHLAANDNSGKERR